MLKRKIITLIFYFLALHCFAQRLVYQDYCHCGVTGNGGSVGIGAGTIHFNVLIPFGSSIKKAYLIAYEDGQASDISVTLNGQHYTFNNSNIVTDGFISYNGSGTLYSNSSIHLINISNSINPNTTNYALTIPAGVNEYIGFYKGFYLYIVYQKPTLPLANTALFLNNQNVSPFTHYHLDSLNPINNMLPVGLEVMTTDFCDTIKDGSYVQVNNDTIGLIGGADTTSYLWGCVGPYPNFAYYNDSLFGLADDTPDSLMAGPDATADIKSYINNQDTAVDIYFKYQSNFGPYTNPIRAVILNYVTSCDTFTTSLSADTAICPGDSVQLNATGGISYQWQPSYGLSCDTCANPIASPDSSVTYTVRIWHTDSCSKVLPVRVLVHKIKFNYYIDSATCGDSNGAVFITTPNIAQYTLASQSNATGIFTHLSGGSYNVLLTDSFGCQWQDTVHIGFSNNAYAAFLLTPFIGQAPLAVHTTNLSNHTNVYLWIVNGDTLHSNTITYTFDSAGHYTVTLIACHNSYPCCDTLTRSVTVQPPLIDSTAAAFVPNVFTPNGDGINDVFKVTLKNVAQGEWAIYNRWGTQLVHTYLQQANENGSLTLQWNGKTTQGKACSAGTYYYVVTYTTPDGKTKNVKGYVTLLR